MTATSRACLAARSSAWQSAPDCSSSWILHGPPSGPARILAVATDAAGRTMRGEADIVVAPGETRDVKIRMGP